KTKNRRDEMNNLHKTLKAPPVEPKAESVEPYWPLSGKTNNLIEVLRENLGGNGIDAFRLPQIRVPPGGGTTWVINDTDEPVRDLEGILLGWPMQRTFWKRYFPASGGRGPPDCVSHDGLHGKGDPGGSCKLCPNPEWDSAPQGGRGQACKLSRHLLLIRPYRYLPHLLVVPPTSLDAVDDYFVQ